MTPEKIQTVTRLTVEAITAAGELRAARDRSRLTTAAAARRIEQALGRVLAEAGLLAFVGAPNLGTGSLILRGINVRTKHHDDKLRRAASNGPAPLSLVLDGRGRLMMATIVRDGDLAMSLRAATDEDLLPDDLALIAEAAIELLSCHREHAGGRVDSLERNATLAHNLDAALRAWDLGHHLPDPS